MVKLVTLDAVTLANAAQAYALSVSTIEAISVTVEAEAANGGNVWIGGEDVDNSTGHLLEPGATAVIEVPGFDSQAQLNLADVFCVGDTPGDVVRISYLKRV